MTYKYSVCYPDKEEIDYFNNIIKKEQVVQIFKNFDWEHELKKEGDWYSPSLDFINLSNKKRLILSGLGTDKLECFQVMYILPNDENALEAFDDENYKMAEDYNSECTIEESYEILDEFLNENYDEIISRLMIKGNKNPSLASGDLELIKGTDMFIEKGMLPKGDYEVIRDEVSGNIEIREVKEDDELIKEFIEKGMLPKGDYEVIRNETSGKREIRAIKKDDELIKEYIEKGILSKGNYEVIRDEVSGNIEFRAIIKDDELIEKYIGKGMLPKGDYEIIRDKASGNIEFKKIKSEKKKWWEFWK